jgi:DNA-binding response OmpR family regulator
MRVLQVDDDDRIREALSRLLRENGFEVSSYADGMDGLAALPLVAPELIITDCQMPRMDGITFTRSVRAAGCPVPVIMLSGQTDPAVVQIALAAGVDHYLHKPLRPALLLETIRSFPTKLPHAA